MKHKQIEYWFGGEQYFLDKKIIPFFDFFNFHGLFTKTSCYCCRNHIFSDNSFYIGFEDNIKDFEIENFIAQYVNKYGHSSLKGMFIKYCRMVNNKIKYNWFYIAKNYAAAASDLKMWKGE